MSCFESEKEKEDESSPRGVLDELAHGLVNQPASPKPQSSVPENHTSNLQAPHHWHKFWKIWKGPKISRLPSFPPLAVPRSSRRKITNSRENVENLCPVKSTWKNFTLSDLRSATNNFSQGLECLFLQPHNRIMSIYHTLPILFF